MNDDEESDFEEGLEIRESSSIDKYIVKPEEFKIRKINEKQREKFNRLIINYEEIFAEEIYQLGRTNIIKHGIKIEENVKLIRQQYYRTNPANQQYIEEEIQRLLKDRIIKKSFSPWTSPVVLVKKKNRKLRFCVDYRKLNSITKKDAYPLPRIDEMLNTLKGSKWFSTLDLASGYWQVAMHPTDREKTAFVTRYGIYEFNVMPFGLCNASATFQRLMDHVYKGIAWKFVVVYLDDTIVYSRTFDEHLTHLKRVFNRIKQAGLRLNIEKRTFWMHQLPFLGHLILAKGIAPDPQKVEAVQRIQPPKNLTALRFFLGLAEYYRQFIQNFSSIARPLNSLLQKDEPYHWQNKQQKAFEELKSRLITAPILAYPNFKETFILATDASYNGFGATVSQLDRNGKEHPIAYASKSLRKEEMNYAATELECAAVVWAIEHFHKYLGATKFILVTDHSALK